MRRKSLAGMACGIAAVLLLWGQTALVRAGQEVPLHDQVVRLGQVTGDDAFKGQLADLLKDKKRAGKLLTVAVKMAKAKDAELNYSAAWTLAQVALEQKDLSAAEPLFRVCMDQAIKVKSPTKVIQTYSGLIEALYGNQKYGAAANVCRELLELRTDKDRVYITEVVDKKTGMAEFDEDPEFDLTRQISKPEVHRVMIMAIAKDGKHEQALKLVDNLVRQNDDWQDRQLRGWILRDANRFAEAAKVYEDVVERIDKDATLTQKGKDFYGEKYRYLLSNIYVDLKQIDKAGEHLKFLMGRHPENPGYYNDLGYIWADNDTNLKEAEVLIRKALDLDRENRKKEPDFKAAADHDKGAYLDSLGWVLFKQKRYEDAKKYLVQALEDKNAQHIEIFDHLGETYIGAGAAGQSPGCLAAGFEGCGRRCARTAAQGGGREEDCEVHEVAGYFISLKAFTL